jgi:hypothetical protein
MLNPERVDVLNPKSQFGNVEIEFTTEDADPALTIVIKESDAMKLAHMILDQCSYKAKKERGV